MTVTREELIREQLAAVLLALEELAEHHCADEDERRIARAGFAAAGRLADLVLNCESPPPPTMW
jgi:hypothetical protein